jgi:hypothetical protein
MDSRRTPNQDEKPDSRPSELLADVWRSFWMRGTAGLEANGFIAAAARLTFDEQQAGSRSCQCLGQ